MIFLYFQPERSAGCSVKFSQTFFFIIENSSHLESICKSFSIEKQFKAMVSGGWPEKYVCERHALKLESHKNEKV